MNESSLGTLLQFPKEYRWALAHWSALRRLGFSAEEIFMGFGTVSGEPNMLHLALKTQGKMFVAVVAPIPDGTPESVAAVWLRAATAFNQATDAERNACFREHLMGNVDYFASFTQSIISKGIWIPEPTISSLIARGQA